jgi:transcriptional regulator with XRE-family HTH domain
VTTTTRNPHPAVERLTAVQRARGWPDHVVAELLGVSSFTWRNYRKGKHWPTLDRIWRVAEVAAQVSAEEAQP